MGFCCPVHPSALRFLRVFFFVFHSHTCGALRGLLLVLLVFGKKQSMRMMVCQKFPHHYQMRVSQWIVYYGSRCSCFCCYKPTLYVVQQCSLVHLPRITDIYISDRTKSIGAVALYTLSKVQYIPDIQYPNERFHRVVYAHPVFGLICSCLFIFHQNF